MTGNFSVSNYFNQHSWVRVGAIGAVAAVAYKAVQDNPLISAVCTVGAYAMYKIAQNHLQAQKLQSELQAGVNQLPSEAALKILHFSAGGKALEESVLSLRVLSKSHKEYQDTLCRGIWNQLKASGLDTGFTSLREFMEEVESQHPDQSPVTWLGVCCERLQAHASECRFRKGALSCSKEQIQELVQRRQDYWVIADRRAFRKRTLPLVAIPAWDRIVGRGDLNGWPASLMNNPEGWWQVESARWMDLFTPSWILDVASLSLIGLLGCIIPEQGPRFAGGEALYLVVFYLIVNYVRGIIIADGPKVWLGDPRSLEKLPERLIQDVPAVPRLELNACHLAAIPSDLSLFVGLQHLDLSQNHIRVLSADLMKLTALTHLNVSQNRIAEIPQDLVNLTRLIFLNLSRNRIQAIPQALQPFLQTHGADLRENPATTPLP